MSKKILWVGDAACDSGFAKSTHYTLDAFLTRGWDVNVIGINYRGDRHKYSYHITPAYVAGGDPFGVRRLVSEMAVVLPDVVVFQNDPWNIPRYMEQANAVDYAESERELGWKRPKFIGAIAVDGKNCRGKDLNGLDHVIFWTEFAQVEALKGGLTKPSSITPLGVDLDVFKPGNRGVARKALGFPEAFMDRFVFLNVNRNQPRKRLDLTIEYFAEWFHSQGRPNAALHLHVCPTGDLGYDCKQLIEYYGLRGHVMLSEPGVYHGLSEDEVALTYQSANVVVSTTQGEGWGLTTMEAMACGIPCVVPDWAALGEWAKPAAWLVPCPSHTVTPNKVNVIGATPDRLEFIHALDTLYRSPDVCQRMAIRGFELVQENQYRWTNIAHQFADQVYQACC